MSAEDAENDEKKTTSPSKDSVTSVDQDEDDEAEDDEDVPTWNIRLVFLEPDMNDVFGYASEDGLSIRWDDGDEWTKTFGGGGHSNAYNIDDLLSAAGNISKLRNVLNSYAPEESIEAVHLCAKEYNKILGKLSQYFVKKFKDLVRKTAKAPLAPPNLKAAAFSLGPPIKLLTGAEKGKERKAPINVGWWKDKGNVEAVESQPIVVKDIELKSERFRYLEKDVGGIVVGIAVKTPISKTNFKEGKSYGYQGNKVWVNKGAHAIFSVAIMKPDKDAKASIMLVHKPGAVITTDIKTHCGGDNDYKPTRDFVFKLFFYDGDSTDKRKQFVSVSGFLMDGTCVEHAIGITTDGDKHDCYCVAPPEIHRGGVRASVSLERKTGLKKFVGGLQKFGAGVGKAFVGSRSNLAFVRTDVKRSVGWHEFKFIGSATKGVRYYVDKKCVYTSNTPRSIVEIESVRLWAGTLEDKGLVSDIRKLKFGGKKKPPAKAIFAGFTFLSTARKMEIPNSKAVIRPKIPPAFATLLDELVTNFRTLESLPPVTDEKTKTTRSMKEYIVDMIEPAVAERVKQSGDEDTQDLLDGTLKITVRRGENLEIDGVKGEMSVKISVPGSDRKALASSAQVHATQNPEWNWDRTFDLDAKKDRENVKILLVLSSKKAGDEVIGRIIMPMRKFIKTGRHDEKGKDYDLVGKVGGSLNIQIKHTSQGVLDLQGAWGDDFEIEDDGEEDEVIAEDDDKLSAEKAKALIKGLDSILDDQLYLNVIRNENTEEGIRIKSSFSAEMQAELMLRLALMYHDRVIKLIEDHTKQYKLETIRAVQLVSWLNSYRQRVEMLAVHFPNGSPDFDALKNKIFRDTGRMGALCMERYVTFRGKQQNSIVSRLISGEERFDVDEDTLAMWDRDGVNPSDVKTYTPQSLFTIVETSIDTIGSKYHISGKQLSREIHIQLSALEHFAQSLSILYDRVDFVPIYTKKNKRITSRDPDDIFGMSVADAKQIKTTDFLIEPGSAAGSSSRRAGDAKEVKKVRKSYYFLVASINNLELYKRYAEGVQKKLRERYVVDVDDLDDIKRGFDEILKELKGQAERCTGFLAQLIINNCDEIIAGLFTDEWTKPDCKFIDLVIERMQEGVDLFTNADIMESDEMADLVFQETILRFGLAYVYEANRKDVDKLRSDQLLEGVQRDYKVLCKIVLERLDEKAQEKIMPKLLPISLITGILLAPPMYKPLCQACVEFRKKLSFSSDDENNICRKILACRSDIARKDMVKITKGLKKGAFEGFTDVTLDDSKDALGGETKSDWVLDVTIEEGSDLMICDATTSDPFVIMTVIEDGHVVYRDKSPIRKKTLYPNWSYTVKKIPKKIMSEFDEIRFEVWDHDFWGSNDFMGCYDLQRSEILEGVQNAELQGEEIRPGAARFHLDLGPRFDEDGKKITSDGKIKGQIQVVVEHRVRFCHFFLFFFYFCFRIFSRIFSCIFSCIFAAISCRFVFGFLVRCFGFGRTTRWSTAAKRASRPSRLAPTLWTLRQQCRPRPKHQLRSQN